MEDCPQFAKEASVLRLLTLLFTTLLVGLPLTTSAASAAPAPSAVHGSQSDDPADDATADDSDSSGDDADADDSSDDSFDLSAYCSILSGDDSGDDGAADDAADDGTITIDLGVLDTLGPDAQDDPEAADDTADDSSADEDCAGAEDSANSTPSSGTRTASVSDMLKTGTVNTGTVTMSGPGTITQELWLPAVAPAKHGLRAVVSSKASTKARTGKLKKAKARKATGRTLGGRVTRTVTRAGVVNLKVTLNAAARKLLRNSKKDVRITVKTTTRVKGGKAQTKNGTLVARRKAAK
jgi:hypothetical protein